MVNQDKIRKRAWKYFWEQKRQEIKAWWNENKDVFVILSGAPLILGMFFFLMIHC